MLAKKFAVKMMEYKINKKTAKAVKIMKNINLYQKLSEKFSKKYALALAVVLTLGSLVLSQLALPFVSFGQEYDSYGGGYDSYGGDYSSYGGDYGYSPYDSGYGYDSGYSAYESGYDNYSPYDGGYSYGYDSTYSPYDGGYDYSADDNSSYSPYDGGYGQDESTYPDYDYSTYSPNDQNQETETAQNADVDYGDYDYSDYDYSTPSYYSSDYDSDYDYDYSCMYYSCDYIDYPSYSYAPISVIPVSNVINRTNTVTNVTNTTNNTNNNTNNNSNVNNNTINNNINNVINIPFLTTTTSPSVITPVPNLAISKTVRNQSNGETFFSESTSAENGDTVVFSLKVDSTGDSTAQNVIVSDSLPFQLSYVSGSSRVDGNQISDGIVSGGINLGSMSAGSSHTVTFSASVNTNVNTTVINTGFARADNVAQKQDTATVIINQIIPQNPSLNISKLVRNLSNGETFLSESTNARVGDRVEFSLKVDSVGTGALQNTIVRDQLPSGLNYVSGSTMIDGISVTDGIVSGGINIGTILSGFSRIVKFQAQVQNTNFGQGQVTLTNFGFARADNVSEKSDTASVVVAGTNPIPGSNMNIVKRVDNITFPNGTAFDNQARVGDELKFTLQFSNTGNTTLFGVQVIDTLPSYTSFISADNAGNFDSSRNTIFWQINNLAPGASGSVSYRVKVQTVPSNGFVIANQSLMKAQNVQDVVSNETRTTVFLTTIITPVKAVTGADSIVKNLIYSLVISFAFGGAAYLALRYSDLLRMFKLKLAILKIKMKES